MRLLFVTGLNAGSSRLVGTGVLIAMPERKATKSIKAFLMKDCGENQSAHSGMDRIANQSGPLERENEGKFIFAVWSASRPLVVRVCLGVIVKV